MANIVDPDEMAHYEPSHLDLHCWQKYPAWSTELKRLIMRTDSQEGAAQESRAQDGAASSEAVFLLVEEWSIFVPQL